MGAEGTELAARLTRLVPQAKEIDHIGSTAVPGLPAKDCLDVMVQVDRLDNTDEAALRNAGFRRRPEEWNRVETTDGVRCPKIVFAGPPGERLCNVHVRVAGGPNVRYALLFRDFLREDEAARDAWGAFKSRLAETVTDLADYGQIKASVQPLLMREAQRWADGAGWAPPGFDVQHDGRPCPGS